MVILIIIAVIFLLLIFIKMRTRRIKISVLTGYVLTIIFILFAFLLLLTSLQREILLSFLIISYISIIAFLTLWNIKESKKNYFLLCIPVLCFSLGIITNIYFNKIREIPTVSEKEYFLNRYEPFRNNNLLAKLTEESNFKILENFPILDGATALVPVYASFIQAVYSERDFPEKSFFYSGTDRAFRNLLEGRVDIIFCAEPSDSQIQQFNEIDIKLKLIPIGREAFVFFVNYENVVNDISIDNIRGIYTGKIRNWKILDGKNEKIIAFQREKNSGSQTMFEKIFGIPIKNPRRENVQGDMIGIINQVADYRNFSNAIGYSFLYFATEMIQNNQIKLLSINGIYPSRETIQNNTYPFSGNFYAIYIDKENENIESFINWMLSEQGQTLIFKTGYVPIENVY